MSGNIGNGPNGGFSEQFADFRVRCHQAGLKVTPQRTAVYQALLMTDEHPSADALWRAVRKVHPNISLDTVNRTLITLSQIGVASIMEGSGDPRRFDGNLDDHQHFRCRKCRKIFDLFVEGGHEVSIPDELDRFIVEKKTVYFEGICDSCCNDG